MYPTEIEIKPYRAISTALRYVSTCLLVLSLGACVGSKPHVASTLRAQYKLNPNPKQRYEVTVRIANAPGVLQPTSWSAYYEAPNCRFAIDRISGASGQPDYQIDVDLKKIDGTTYKGSFYADAMLDEDYFGQGTCRWQLSSTTITMKATGKKEETAFISSLMGKQLLAGNAVTSYFQSKFYPSDPNIKDLPIFGRTDRAAMHASILDKDLFKITLVPKKLY